MRHVLIIEPHQEVAAAFERAIASAQYGTIVRPHVALLSDLGVTPVMIVLRIGHADVSTLAPERPPIIAIASSDEEVEEAGRLHCEVVLRTPSEIRRLREVLRSAVAAA